MRSVCHAVRSKLAGRVSVANVTADVPPTIFLSSSVRELRSTGQVQIRKVVDGVVTVLASANFAAVRGQYYDVRFRVINDQLQLYVDRALVAAAHDRAIASGKYGLATYRAAARWETFWVNQP